VWCTCEEMSGLRRCVWWDGKEVGGKNERGKWFWEEIDVFLMEDKRRGRG